MGRVTHSATVLLAMLAALAPLGCGPRWIPNAPFRLDPPARGQVVSIHRRLAARAAALGYRVDRADPRRGRFHVWAFLDRGPDPQSASYFTVQVLSDRSVIITPAGRHVRDKGTVIHRKLFAELSDFAAEMQAAIAR